MKSLLTIAGLDPSSGAGLTKDLDVFGALGFHGLCVPSALVIQGPYGVERVVRTVEEDFSHMLTLLKDEVEVSGVKLGVLATEGQVRRAARFLAQLPAVPVVLDPVLYAKNGVALTSKTAFRSLLREIVPLGPVITPNLAEAEALSGRPINNLADMRESARALCARGARAVVIKGGHLAGEPTDVLFDGQSFTEYQKERVPREVHGSGCLFSSVLLAFLARGYPLAEAFRETQEQMVDLFAASYQPGKGGYYYTSLGLANAERAERFQVLGALREAGEELARLAPVELVPAVQINLGYALPGAKSAEEVAAFPGRIGSFAGKLLFKGEPAFGASSHVARLILTMMRRHPELRACVNLRYREDSLAKARAADFVVARADRSSEPPEVRETEGRSLDFLVDQALASTSEVPDIIYDEGAVGKEPLIRLFAKTPAEVIKKLKVVRP